MNVPLMDYVYMYGLCKGNVCSVQVGLAVNTVGLLRKPTKLPLKLKK